MPKEMIPISPGMKIALQAPPEPTELDLQFIRQMGLEYVVLWTGGDKASYEYYNSRRELYEQAGIKVYGFGNSAVHNQDAITLNLPGRDEKIEEYKRHIRNLGKAERDALLARIGWVDTYLGILAPNFASAFGVFMLRQGIKSIPNADAILHANVAGKFFFKSFYFLAQDKPA